MGLNGGNASGCREGNHAGHEPGEVPHAVHPAPSAMQPCLGSARGPFAFRPGNVVELQLSASPLAIQLLHIISFCAAGLMCLMFNMTTQGAEAQSAPEVEIAIQCTAS